MNSEPLNVSFYNFSTSSLNVTAHHFHVTIGLNVVADDWDDGPCKHCAHTTQRCKSWLNARHKISKTIISTSVVFHIHLWYQWDMKTKTWSLHFYSDQKLAVMLCSLLLYILAVSRLQKYIIMNYGIDVTILCEKIVYLF